jgi:peptidoglycan/LPS O-acetylase OafA/YrhL
VLGVVLFHAHVGLLRGGFVGVDVFFVVSGYLITGLLWRELSRSGRLSLAGFYGRRARRLLPASVLVIVVTAVAAHHWLPPLQTPAVAKDGLASALYVANYRFAFAQTNYLNSSAPPSPYQHYWSLGVEEQFYLLWPLLLLVAALAWRYRGRYQRRHLTGGGRPNRWTTAGALAVVTGASFFLSLWLTHANQPWAFFSLGTRAWELGAGGLLALAAPTVRRLAPRPAAVLGWIGLGVIIGTFLVISSTTPFPGTAALVPVLGTVAVLAAGEAGAGRVRATGNAATDAGPVRLLGRPPMKLMGRISYSWYLWHWPFLILAPYAVGHALNLPENLLVAAISGLVAMATYALLETPVRDSRWLAAVPRRSLATGAVLSGAGALACVLVATTLPSLSGHGRAPVAALHTGVPVDKAPAKGATPPPNPLAVELASIDGQIRAAVTASVGTRVVPANLLPSIAGAHNDEAPVFFDGCMDSYLDATVRDCASADTASPTTVVLFGDSHAAMWWPAVDYAADQHHWKLLTLTKATCPPIDISVFSPVLGRHFSECDAWRQSVLARIAAVHPALVILGVARHYTSVYGFTPYDQQWLNGMAQMIRTIRPMGSKVMVIGPVPKPPELVPDCLSAHLDDATACTVRVDQAFNTAGLPLEETTVRAAGGSYVDTRPWFCTRGTCAVIVDNLEVWRDDNHITATYSTYLGPAISAELAEILRPG